jgi:UDP-N-acetylglucosamine acyltransferase
MICHGNATIVQHNIVGMRRAGYDRAALAEIRQAYHILYRTGMTFRKAVEQLAQTVQTDAGQKLVQFLQAESKRGICGGRKRTLRENDGSAGPSNEIS